MKTVLITGVTGFLGRYIARQFSQAGWTVTGIGTRPPENAPQQDLAYYYQLVLPSPDLAAIAQQLKPEVCIHCAGRASVELSVSDPASDFQASVSMTFQLLDTLRLYAPNCHLIYLSSAAVYGSPDSLPIAESQTCMPISPYGFHKLMGEQLCREFFQIYNLPTTIARIFSAYGAGLRRQVVWDICQKALTQPSIKLRGTGNESRDFIHGADVAKAMLVLSEQSARKASIYNLGTGVETKIKDLITLILANINPTAIPEFDGNLALGIPLNWQADVTKINSIGFSPIVSIDKGISSYIHWCWAEVLGYE
ncbi:nucleoside-diphosphate-sugar epimerase [Synechococcus sp. PCC 7502]|uniref:NAD-dependent epimerase/dehydratase family protein n=1 Tax=Synechococcus sp. PCC 7502 TaxID=1173263 RepID=UPI00029FBCE5|nr:SDR family oxidoreductase [Synechococcus sp. PCC 7502]AFY75125.1 nucleoside-diphosphate-sugar epimerase [Synechococcus sp. PCC 7502]